MNTGVSRAFTARPTMTGIDNCAALSSRALAKAHSRNEGMFTAISGPAGSSGSQRRRSSDSSIWRTRTSKGVASWTKVSAPRTPSGFRPWRSWNVRTASTSAPS